MLDRNDFYVLDYLNVLSQDLDNPHVRQEDRAEKRVVIESMKTQIFAKALTR